MANTAGERNARCSGMERVFCRSLKVAMFVLVSSAAATGALGPVNAWAGGASVVVSLLVPAL